jgi:hypothetical protein
MSYKWKSNWRSKQTPCATSVGFLVARNTPYSSSQSIRAASKCTTSPKGVLSMGHSPAQLCGVFAGKPIVDARPNGLTRQASAAARNTDDVVGSTPVQYTIGKAIVVYPHAVTHIDQDVRTLLRSDPVVVYIRQPGTILKCNERTQAGVMLEAPQSGAQNCSLQPQQFCLDAFRGMNASKSVLCCSWTGV